MGTVEISNDDISSAMIECDNNSHRNVVNTLPNNLRSPKVHLGIVALELRNPGNDGTTQIYALHDTGSQITMSHSPIARKLGLMGVTKQIAISRINTCKAVEAFKISVKSRRE